MGSQRAERVLVYRLGSLGDHLVALPCYRLVRKAFPGAEIRLATNRPVSEVAPRAAAVLDGMGLVDGYLFHEPRGESLGDLLRLVREIWGWRPQVLVYLAGARGKSIAYRDRLFFALCGVWRQVGVPVTEDMQEHRSAVAPVWMAAGTPWVEGEGERLARCVAELGDARVAEDGSWGLELSQGERAEGARLVEGLGGVGYFCFSVGTKVQSNDWGLERWKELVARVSVEYPGYGLVLVGAAEDWAASEEIARMWRGGATKNLCGMCPPRVSAAVMERADMFLGHDSGPGHLAAAVGTAVLAVFGSRNLPGQWVPHGRGVRTVQHWVECGNCLLDVCVVERKRCLRSISVDEVMMVFRQHAAALGLRGTANELRVL